MKKISLTLVVAASLVLSFVANATPVADKGFYVGTNVGYSSMDLGDSVWNTTTGFGYNVHGGYMFNQNWGAELGYTHYADAKASVSSSIGSASATYKAYSIDVAAKGVYYVQPELSLFGKLGFASLHVENTTTGTILGYSGSYTQSATKIKPLLGLGAGYNATPNFTINVGWSYVMGGNDVSDPDSLGNMSLLYAGIDYHF